MLDNDIFDEDMLSRIQPDTLELSSTQLFELEKLRLSASADIEKETRFRIIEKQHVNNE